MFAKDVMTRDVASISPEMPIVDIADLLLSRKIGAVPVVDAERRVVGIVGEKDLMHRSELGTEPHHTWWHDLFAGREQHAVQFMKVHGMRATHVMTRDVITAGEDTSLADLVGMFDRFHVSCVPIVADDQLAGVVYRRDLLRPLAGLKQRPLDADTSDTHIRAQLDKLLHEAAWATVTPVSSLISFQVNDGIVRMTGIVGSEAEREALHVAATAIAGVRSVQDELAVVPRDISAI